MHPSDSRMSSWTSPSTFTVGTSAVSEFPMALFKALSSITIRFNVPSSQAGAATLRIGTTLSFAGGRPSVTVNGAGLTTPAAPTKIDSRGVTRGAYRGYGEIYTYAISNLVSGTNTIVIGVASGSDGTTFLSPNFVSHFCPLSPQHSTYISLRFSTLSIFILQILPMAALTQRQRFAPPPQQQAPTQSQHVR